MRLVQTFQRTAREVVARHGGRIVKFLGDGALAEFASTDEAVRSASGLMDAFAREIGGTPPTALRIGVHVGDVVTAPDGDLYGDGVNVASRIQSAAEPGEVWTSEDVWRQLRQRPAFHFEARGEPELRGMDAPLAVYAVKVAAGAANEAGDSWTDRPPLQESRRSNWHRVAGWLVAGIILASLALGASLWLGRHEDRLADASAAADSASADSIGRAAHSIAVLPFTNLSDEPDNEYFADGITEDILTSLSKVGALRVISRTSSQAYEGTSKPMRQIAAELGAGAILEGSVRREGSQVRITVQLVDGRTDEHLWAESYDRELTHIFEIQSEIAGEIARRLEIVLTGEDTDRIAAGRTEELTAYDLVLRARRLVAEGGDDATHGRENVHEGIKLLSRSVELDPGYARAWAEIGLAYGTLMFREDIAWGDSALEAVDKAIALDPRLGSAYAARGVVHIQMGLYDQSVADLEQAVELDPNDAESMHWLSVALAFLGRYDDATRWERESAALRPGELPVQLVALFIDLGLLEEAEKEVVQDLRRNPHGSTSYIWLARIRMLQGRKREALELTRQAVDLAPNDLSTLQYAYELNLAAGDNETAAQLIERSMIETSEEFAPLVSLGTAYWRMGERGRARALFERAEARARAGILRSPQYNESYLDLARIAAVQGRPETAMEWLEQVYQRGFRDRWILEMDATLQDVRGTREYQAWAKKILDDLSRMRRNFEDRPWIRG